MAHHFKDGILQNSVKYINEGGGILLETSSGSAP